MPCAHIYGYWKNGHHELPGSHHLAQSLCDTGERSVIIENWQWLRRLVEDEFMMLGTSLPHPLFTRVQYILFTSDMPIAHKVFYSCWVNIRLC